MLIALLSPALGYVYWTPEQVLASFAPGAAWSQQSFAPTPAQTEAIRSIAGPITPSWTIHVATADGTVLGYALFDSEKGQHDPIDFAVYFTPAGAVARVEVLVYREPYGDGVRGEGFRAQFVGKTAADRPRAGKDIKVVSGATISSRSTTTMVTRTTQVLTAWLAGA